ncbi:PREDICTED: mitotic spindle assembly checkpoint protein MAD2B [Dinoponera quadriceps]|uniref:Mitotic spindle assembly checkpoint protein MAD2B n=1 Tax=Dinoponera quadriceps TaxID=609295 RepID=A0A6P3XGL8_DINQU|nr:PREDICTED: mitotic spindle assembly checkpoint protein MAD2B [Dinoponera quadriceps]
MSQDNMVGIDVLLEFLEVAFHHILFCRKIYPKEIFVKKKIYGITVHMSEHPELNKYFFNVLNATRELIKEDENSVKTIHFTFYNRDKLPIEKFVFDVIKLRAESTEKDPYYLKTEEALRTICLKISICDTYLEPLPDGSIFSIEIQTYETAHITLSENSKCEDFPWIVEDDAIEMANKNLLPLKDIKTDCLNLQMYVIEDAESKNATDSI